MSVVCDYMYMYMYIYLHKVCRMQSDQLRPVCSY